MILISRQVLDPPSRFKVIELTQIRCLGVYVYFLFLCLCLGVHLVGNFSNRFTLNLRGHYEVQPEIPSQSKRRRKVSSSFLCSSSTWRQIGEIPEIRFTSQGYHSTADTGGMIEELATINLRAGCN